MISVKKHAVRICLLSIFTLILWGCGGGTPAIKNGVPVTGVSGALDSVKTYRINIPDNTNALLIALTGSPDLQAELLNADGTNLLLCPSLAVSLAPCSLLNPPAGDLELKLTSVADYENVSIAASWGGPDAAVLANAVPLADLKAPADSIRLASFFMEAPDQVLSLHSSGLLDSELQLLDSQGQLIQPCGQRCQVAGLAPGLYFVRIQNSLAYTGASLVASWGSPSTATLANGIPKRGLSGVTGERLVETLYLPAQADSIMVHSSSPGVALDIINQQGAVVMNCPPAQPCTVSGLTEGLYSVAMVLSNDEAAFSITAAWGGEDMTSLAHGAQRPWSDAEVDDVFLDTFAAPQDAEFVAVAPLAEYVVQEVFSAQGERVASCWLEQPCILPQPQADLYFVKSQVTGPSAPQQFHVALNYGGPLYDSLERRQRKQNQAVPDSGFLIETFSAQAQDRRGVFAATLGTRVKLYGGDGVEFHCEPYRPCLLDLQSPSSFIAYVHNEDDGLLPVGSPVSVAFSTWSEQGGTLLNQDQVQAAIQGDADLQLETFSTQEDVAAFMLAAPDTRDENPLLIEILTADDGAGVAFCYDFEPCIATNTGAKDYVVLIGRGGSAPQDDVVNTVSLTFGGTAYTTIANGGVNRHALATGAFAVESMVVPFTTELMQFAASPSGLVDVYSAHGEWVCRQQVRCSLLVSSSNVLFARVTQLDGTFTELNTSLALGAEGVGSMASGDQKTLVLPNETGMALQSFYLPEGIEGGVFAAFSADGVVNVRIRSRDGREICSAEQGCGFSGARDELYFVEMTMAYSAVADQPITVNVSLLLGSQQQTTLESSGSFYDLNLAPGAMHLSSFYLSDEFNSLALASSPDMLIRVYDEQGLPLPEQQIYSHLPPGLYFVQVMRTDDPWQSASGFSIALGGEQHAVLQRGRPASFEFVADGRVDVQSFYLPENADSVLLVPSPLAWMTEIRHSEFGPDVIASCSGETLCHLAQREAGTYFVYSYLPDDGFEPAAQYSMTMQYLNSVTGGSMNHGQIATVDALEPGQFWIESFYLAQHSIPLAVGTSANTSLKVVHEFGGGVGPGAWSSPVLMSTYDAQGGGYYALMEANPDYPGSNQEEVWYNNHSVKALWGNEPTMVNGGAIAIGRDHVVLESFRVEEGAAANFPEIYSGMVTHTVEMAWSNLFSEFDYQTCDLFWEPCRFNINEPGLYYVFQENVHDYPDREVGSLSLAWGGPKGTSLENGKTYQTLPFDTLNFAVHSVYLPVQTTLTFNLPENTTVEVYDGYPGDHEVGCYGATCELTLEPGLHFIYFRFDARPALGTEGVRYQVLW